MRPMLVTAVGGALALGFAAAAQDEPATAPLDVQVITVSDASLAANIVLVSGETHAALIDVPFTRADTHRVVAAILESGNTLETVWITHDHPDHFFGVDLIADSFPDARIITSPAITAAIERSIPLKFARWGPMLGANGPARGLVPEAYEGDHFMLDGRRVEILGPMQGDHLLSTAVWLPDTKTLVTGDLAFDNVHLWLGEHLPEHRADWAESLAALAALGPETVVAGHVGPSRADGGDALAWTAAYLAAFETFVAESESGAELAQKLRARYPDASDFAGDFIVTNSTQVAMGEMEPWDE